MQGARSGMRHTRFVNPKPIGIVVLGAPGPRSYSGPDHDSPLAALLIGLANPRTFEQAQKKPAQGGLNYSEFRDPVARRIAFSVGESFMKV